MASFRRIGPLALVVLANVIMGLVFFLPPLGDHWILITLVLVVFAVPAIGWYWNVYDAMRYEKRPWPHVLLSLIPYWFVWHYFERVRKRSVAERQPAAFR
jgi:hypothetical protein